MFFRALNSSGRGGTGINANKSLPLFADSSNDLAASFDVCIDVSGSLSGLADAISSCRPSGKVVMGSWYSDSTNSENPGPNLNSILTSLAFHRSKIQLVSSQVSEIPGRLADNGRWTK